MSERFSKFRENNPNPSSVNCLAKREIFSNKCLV